MSLCIQNFLAQSATGMSISTQKCGKNSVKRLKKLRFPLSSFVARRLPMDQPQTLFPDEVYRQVPKHPAFLSKDGQPLAANFQPRPKDKNLLSVDDGAKWSAKQSFDYHFAKQAALKLTLRTAGSWSIKKAGLIEQKLPPLVDQEAAPDHAAHMLIDMQRWAVGSEVEKLLIIGWFLKNTKKAYPL